MQFILLLAATSAVVAASWQCEQNETFAAIVAAVSEYSVITQGDMVIRGNAAKPVVVGGELTNAQQWTSYDIQGTSYVGALNDPQGRLAGTFLQSGFPSWHGDWARMVDLMQAIVPTARVHVFDRDGTFTNFDLFSDPNDPRAYNGQTLAVFTTNGVVKTAMAWGHCWGASIFAPLAHVESESWCSQDGFVLAKSFGNANVGVDFAAIPYNGPWECGGDAPGSATPVANPTVSPSACPVAKPTILPSAVPISAPSSPNPSSAPAPAPTPLRCEPQDLLAFLPLDNGSTIDVTGNDNDCSLVGSAGTSLDRFGVPDGAVHLGDGNKQSVTCANLSPKT